MNIFRVPLPIAHQNQLTCHVSKTKREAVDLLTVRQTAVVLSPRAILTIPQKGRTGNVVMDANLRAAHKREKLLRPIGASVVWWLIRLTSNRSCRLSHEPASSIADISDPVDPKGGG
jgi:hypothetical protein